ncbi:hypothetical protein Acsp02_69210 [Actinoplanes sp. NBRC 103695]|nr:hypothetical protein Acsp02_69210 [Actinoplanes sp. NBRC 103695]
MRVEERIRAVIGKQPLEPLLRDHNVGDELFVLGHRSLLCIRLMAVLRPSGDERYQRTPAKNHLFAWGKLSVLTEPFSGERTCLF